MCCKSFWQKIVLFLLAFGFGVFISDTFFPNQSPIITDTGSKKKNCVPVDKSLKYQTLPLKDETYWNERDIEGLVLIPHELKNKGREVKNKKESSADVQNSQTDDAKIKQHLYKPSEDSSEYQTLLHREECYEFEGQE